MGVQVIGYGRPVIVCGTSGMCMWDAATKDRNPHLQYKRHSGYRLWDVAEVTVYGIFNAGSSSGHHSAERVESQSTAKIQRRALKPR
jgi:hypothetical protein